MIQKYMDRYFSKIDTIGKIERKVFMFCLQLGRVPLNNEYLRLPRELLDCYAAVAVRPNISKDLISAMQPMFIDIYMYMND